MPVCLGSVLERLGLYVWFSLSLRETRSVCVGSVLERLGLSVWVQS